MRENIDESQLPAVLVPAEPERPDRAYERNEVKDRVRSAIQMLPVRERRVIGLYYYGEVTMKEIGAELGVNESRVSQLHARAIRRLRDVLGPDVTPAAAVLCIRAAVLAFAVKPRMAKAALPTSDTRVAVSAERRADHRRRCGALRQRVPRGTQQVAEPKRLGKPGAAGFFEEPLGVRAGHRARDENHAAGQRRRRGRHRPIKLHPVDLRHFQIADHEIVGAVRDGGECFFAVAGARDDKARVIQRFGHCRAECGLVIHH